MSSPTSRDHPWLFALALPCLAVAAGMSVQMVAWEFSSTARAHLHHVAALGALALVAARAPVDALGRALLGRRGPVLTWCAVSVGAVALAVSYLLSLDVFLGNAWGFLSYFGRLWELEGESALVPVAMAVAGLSLPRVAVPSRRALRVAAALSTLLAAGVVGAGVARAMRAPEVHRYVASLPSVGAAPDLDRALAWRAGSEREPSTERQVFALRDVTLARYVFEPRGQCLWRLADRPDALPERVLPASGELGDCDGVVVRRDVARGIMVIAQRRNEGDQRAYVRRVGAWELLPSRSVEATRLRGGFALPRAWLYDAVLLLLVAVAAQALPHRARSRLARLDDWREASLGDDGYLTLDDGARVPCPYGAALKPGPVVLLEPVASCGRDGPFRGAVAATPERDTLAQGDRLAVIGDLEAALDARAAWAMAAALLAAAPWAAAVALGLAP